MPTLELPLPRTSHPSECDALLFIHRRHGGVFILLGLVTLVGAFLFGGVWGKYKDSTLGWAIALPGATLIIGYITLVVMMYRQ